MLHFGDELEIRRHERLLLRPWLENLIDSGKVPGLQWIDSTRSLFRVPWKHQSRKTWSLGHSSVFLVCVLIVSVHKHDMVRTVTAKRES